MNDVERAISEISDIRSRLAASTRFRGYAPEAVAVNGLLSLVVMLAQLGWPATLAGSDVRQALVWAAVLVAGGLTVAAELLGRTRRQHAGLARDMLHGAMRTVLPTTCVSAVLGVAILSQAPQVAWLLPGVWQMLIGAAVFSSYSTMPRGMGWPAAWYLAAGAAVTFASGRAGALDPLLCGTPFVVGHLWIAWLLYREGEQRA